MKKSLPRSASAATASGTTDLQHQAFSLDKIKGPAFLLSYEGNLLRFNSLLARWLNCQDSALQNKPITEAMEGLGPEILGEIHDLPPGKSLIREIPGGKISFFPTRYEGEYAILGLASLRDPSWNESGAGPLPLPEDAGFREQPAKGFHSVENKLLLGDIARLAVQESSAQGFVKRALDLIRKRTRVTVLFLEQVAHSFDEISFLGDAQWSGTAADRKKYAWLADHFNPRVLESGTHFLLREEDWKDLIKNEAEAGSEIPCPAFLLIPMLHQKEAIGVLGLVREEYTSRDADFEFLGLSLADLIGQILVQFRRSHAESQLNQRIRKISEYQKQACWTVSADGTVTYFNQAFIDAVMAKGASFGTGISYPSQKGVRSQTGFSDWQEEYNKAFTGEKIQFRWQSADAKGTLYWWNIRLIPLEGSGLGYGEVLGIAEDTSQEHIHMAAIQQHQTEYLELIDAFNDVYFLADTEGTLTTISSAIENLTGLPPARLAGTSLSDYLSQPGQFHRELVQLREGRLVTGVELCIKDNLGNEKWLICNLKPRHSAWGEWTGFEGIARDNSAVRKARWNESRSRLEASDALKVKDRFLANISHEIRTPLNGILGMVQLLQDTSLTREQREFLQIINKSGDALLTVLNQLIDLSSAEAGKIVLKKGRVQVTSLIEGLFRLYADQARLKNIGFSYEVEPGLSHLFSDEGRLYQLLNNLVSNAFKFTIQGEIKIRARLGNGLVPAQVLLEVSDTGCGLSSSEQASIQQLIDSEDPEHAFQVTRGGLGLLTTRLIADALEGRMGFVSAPGTGTTFWVSFPYQPAGAETEELAPPEREKPIRFDDLKPEVLLVDDNAVNLKVAYEILNKAGCRVEVATNGEEAIERARTGFFHVILMDIQMPVMDGVTATQILKGTDLGYSPAIIAMTAYCMKEDKKRFVEAGMDDFIAKPISGDRILSKVQYWTEKNYYRGRFQPAEEGTVKNSQTPAAENWKDQYDFEVLKALHRHLGDEILLASIAEFAQEAENMLIGMQAALVMGNWEELRSLIHTLKGNAGTFGVKVLYHRAKDLENNLKINQLSPVEKQLEDIEESIRKFLATYSSLHTHHEWKN